MTMCTKALLGDPLLYHYDPKATCHWSAVESINNVIKTQKRFWKNLKFQLALPIEPVLEEPSPSIGLVVTQDSDRLSMSSSTMDDSPKSCASGSISELNYSLESNMTGLSIRPKCEDGIHCGTDDEDEKSQELKRETKKQRTDVECFNVERTIIGKDSSAPSGSNQTTTNSNEGASSSAQARLRETPSNFTNRGSVQNEIPSVATQGSSTNQGGSSASQGALSTNRGISDPIEEISSTSREPSSTKQSDSITTPDKQTLVSFLAENMRAIADGDMFAVIPQPWCPHLDSLFAIPNNVRFNQGVKCIDCEETAENWVCLHCFIVSIEFCAKTCER